MDEDDVFARYQLNPKDYAYIGFFVLMGLLLIFNYIQVTGNSGTFNYGSIYIPVFFVSIIIIFGALITKGWIANTVIFGNTETIGKFALSIAVGLAAGFVLISPLLGFKAFSIFTLLQISTTPTNFAFTPASTASILSILFIIGFLAADIEETFRAGALVPFFSRYLSSPNQLPVVLIFAGMLFAFLIPSVVPNSGQLALGIGLAFIIIGIAVAFSKKLKESVAYKGIDRHIISIVLSAFIFSSFHISTNTPIQTAFLFATMVDLINWKLQNTIAGRVIHSMNNSFVTAVSFAIPLVYPAAIVGIYITILYLIYRYGNLSKKASGKAIPIVNPDGAFA